MIYKRLETTKQDTKIYIDIHFPTEYAQIPVLFIPDNAQHPELHIKETGSS